MATRADAYVDTSALIAFLDQSDRHHDLFVRLFSQPPSLLTTALVVSEGHAWFLRRYDRTLAARFLDMIEAMTPLKVVGVDPLGLAGGIAVLKRFADQDLTLTDSVGLHLMDANAIRSCWSTDFHLGLTGVPLVVDQG